MRSLIPKERPFLVYSQFSEVCIGQKDTYWISCKSGSPKPNDLDLDSVLMKCYNSLESSNDQTMEVTV